MCSNATRMDSSCVDVYFRAFSNGEKVKGVEARYSKVYTPAVHLCSLSRHIYISRIWISTKKTERERERESIDHWWRTNLPPVPTSLQSF